MDAVCSQSLCHFETQLCHSYWEKRTQADGQPSGVDLNQDPKFGRCAAEDRLPSEDIPPASTFPEELLCTQQGVLAMTPM